MYVGSTTQPLRKRLDGHRTSFRKWVEAGKGYISSCDILSIDASAAIVLVEAYPCATKEELHKRERFHIEKRGALAVNRYTPATTHKERVAKWYQQNKEKILASKAAWRQQNKEKVLASSAVYRQQNKEKILAYSAVYDKHRRSEFGLMCRTFGSI